MDALQLTGVTAALVNLYAAFDYLKEVVTGEARPERSTMIIWLVTTSIVFITNIVEGAEDSLWFAGSDVLLSIAFFLVSLKYGYGWVAKRDYAGLFIAFVGVVVWQTTNNAWVALSAAIFVDFVGVALIMAKAYEAPETEPVRPWVLYVLSGILAGIAVGEFDLVLLAFPVYVVLSSLALIGVIKLGQKASDSQPKTAKIKHKK